MIHSGKRIAILGMVASLVGYCAIRLSSNQWQSLPTQAQYAIASIGLVGVVCSLWSWWLAFVDWYRSKPRSFILGIALALLNAPFAWIYWIFDLGEPHR
ncbi:MAG TPA: hypothetical protein VHU90_12290 [Galbitalea sp.]|jgi:hypothetical protein|nr:hypothetical protein [Galbitalea sp.]